MGKTASSIEFQNANGSTSDADLMAKTMVSAGCDMITAVATPAAMSAYAAAKDAERARNLPLRLSDPIKALVLPKILMLRKPALRAPKTR